MARYPVVLAIVLLVTVVWYAPLRQVPLVYEDAHTAPVPAPMTWARVVMGTVPGRLLTTWSLEQTVHDPALAHAVNLALHLVAGGLVYGLVTTWVGPLAGTIAASAHLLHPLNHQAVCYVTGRADLLLAIGALLAMWGALLRGWPRGLLVTGGLLLAMGSKETGLVVAPLVLVTLVLRHRKLRPALALGLGASLGLALGLARPVIVDRLSAAPDSLGSAGLAWPEFVIRQIGLTWVLLAKVIVPEGFSIDHDALALDVLTLIGASLATAGAGALAVIAWRRHPVAAWAVVCAGLALAPRVLATSNEFLAERHLYLPLVPVWVLAGWGLARWVERDPERRMKRALRPQEA